jgi:hypothetical protein
MNTARLCLAGALGVAWACSSGIDLVPLDPDAGIDNLRTDPALGGSSGTGGSGPNGNAGSGEVTGPLPLANGGTGGGNIGPSNSGGSGGAAQPGTGCWLAPGVCQRGRG